MALTVWMRRVAQTLKPYLFGALGGGAVMFGLGQVMGFIGGCTAFCDPAISSSLGVIAGLMSVRMGREA